MKTLLKWTLRILVLCLLILAVTGYVVREAIFERAGFFMAPQGNYTADVVILEGADYIRTGFIEQGMDMLKEGKASRIIVVLHRIAPSHRPFGINGDYPDIVRKKLKGLGLTDADFKVIAAPIRPPVTLKEAEYVLTELSGDGINSAILVAPGFHTRRSYLAYAHTGLPLSIRIYPQASFTQYELERWWTDKTAMREFKAETAKLAYYYLRGHIPLRFSHPKHKDSSP